MNVQILQFTVGLIFIRCILLHYIHNLVLKQIYESCISWKKYLDNAGPSVALMSHRCFGFKRVVLCVGSSISNLKLFHQIKLNHFVRSINHSIILCVPNFNPSIYIRVFSSTVNQLESLWWGPRAQKVHRSLTPARLELKKMHIGKNTNRRLQQQARQSIEKPLEVGCQNVRVASQKYGVVLQEFVRVLYDLGIDTCCRVVDI